MEPADRRKELTPQWHAWIAENLARGCAPQSLLSDMVREGFDPASAQQAIAAASPTQSAPRTPYRYEPPRLATGNRLCAANHTVTVSMRLERPAIAVLDDVLSAEECDELIERSASRLRRSTTVDPQRGTHEVIPDRSSDGTYYAVNADPFIARLDQRIAALMNWPLENGEGLQILHYRQGGQYTPHFDYFPPQDPGSAAAMLVGGQRVASLVMYLNDVPAGGGTVFPDLNLTVMPRKGAAVYFEYCNSLGQLDPLTLHGGLPVLAGEKWIATKWMRQRRYAAP
ncbi:MAG: 2OG-Fe(II) oxygenase [Steroidobacteraceae bacterium]